ncbi:hypothetical protein L5D93_00265 [Paenibacillus thiaminolyticus]|nr:hypothetical protein [Paenibacillus thiaminolyticus]
MKDICENRQRLRVAALINLSALATQGVPDRIVILPGNRITFVELKAPGKKPTALQLAQHKHFRALGCDVRIVDSIAQVDELLRELTGI